MNRSAGTHDDDDAPRDGVGDPRNSALSVPGGGGRSARRPRRRLFRGELRGVIVVLVLALVCAGLVAAVVDKTRADAARTAREAASYTPPPIPSASPSSTARPIVAVVSDETATRSAEGVSVAQRWPRVIADELGAEVETTAVAGAGYATAGARDRSFVEAAQEVPSDADVVIFVGGAADLGTGSLAVARAATRAFAAAAEQAPDSTVVAVGPLFTSSSTSTDDVDVLTSTLATSARVGGVKWVNPISARWIAGVSSTSALDRDAESSIASKLVPVIEDALD